MSSLNQFQRNALNFGYYRNNCSCNVSLPNIKKIEKYFEIRILRPTIQFGLVPNITYGKRVLSF